MDLAALAGCLGSSGCLVTQTMSGLISGMLLFMVASGVTLIFGVLGFVNFMHGSFYMIGAYFAYSVYRLTGSFVLATMAGAIGVGMLAFVLEKTIVRRVYSENPLYQILVCYAFILIFDDLARMIWGADFLSMGMPEAFQVKPLFLAGGVVPPFYLLLIGISVAVAVLLMLVLNGTRIGSVIRAAAHNREMVASLGVNTNAVFVLVFVLGAALAGMAGALAAPVRSISVGMGFSILIDSFIVTVIGGLGSIGGALGVALAIGLIRAFGSMGFPLFTEALVFSLMALTLIFRPGGLFGRAARTA